MTLEESTLLTDNKMSDNGQPSFALLELRPEIRWLCLASVAPAVFGCLYVEVLWQLNPLQLITMPQKSPAVPSLIFSGSTKPKCELEHHKMTDPAIVLLGQMEHIYVILTFSQWCIARAKLEDRNTAHVWSETKLHPWLKRCKLDMQHSFN